MVARTISVGNHPAMFTPVQIDRRDPSVRWFEEWQASRSANPFPRAPRVAKIRLGRIAQQKVGNKRRRNRWDVQESGLGIECRALPIRASNRARQLNCSFRCVRTGSADGWGGEQRARHVPLDDCERLLTKLRREVDQIVDCRSLAIESGGLRREWLRRRCSFSRRRRLRNGPLLDWPDWFAGHAIEDVREALLRHLDNRFDRPSVDADVRENRSRRWIEVPQVVMRQLEVPHTLTAVRLHAHEALTKEVVAKEVDDVNVA